MPAAKQHYQESMQEFARLCSLARESNDLSPVFHELNEMHDDDVRHMVFSLVVTRLKLESEGEE